MLSLIYKQYGGEPLFTIDVKEDPSYGNDCIIRLNPVKLGMPLYFYMNATSSNRVVSSYKRMLLELFLKLSNKTSLEAERYVNSFFDYEKRIAAIVPDIETQANALVSPCIMSIVELKVAAPGIPLQKILSDYFPNIHISSSTRIWVPTKDYFRELSEIISTTDKKVFFKYLTMSVMKNMMPYQGKDLRYALNNFKTHLTGVNNHKSRWEFCASIVNEMIPLAFAGLIQNNYETSQNENEIKLNIIDDIYTNLKISMLKRIVKCTLLKKYYQEPLIKKINSIQLKVGLPPFALKTPYLEAYHADIQISSSSLNQNIMNLQTFNRIKKETLLINGKNDEILILYNVLNSPNVFYSRTWNTIYVPQYLTEWPYFHQNSSLAVQYGTLGVKIAKILVSAITNNQSNYTQNQNVLRCFDDKDMDQIYCNEKSFLNLPDSIEVMTNFTALNSFIQIAGIKIALDGLNQKLKLVSKVNQERLPGLEEYEDHEIFFLSYAQNQCSVTNSEYELWYSFNELKLKPKSLLKYVMRKLSDYWPKFSCPKKVVKDAFCSTLFN